MSHAAARPRAGKTAVPVQRALRAGAPRSMGADPAGPLQNAGPLLGLGAQRQVTVGAPGDRFEHEADAAADRISTGRTVAPSMISPVTTEALAGAAPQPAVEVQRKGSGPGPEDRLYDQPSRSMSIQRKESGPDDRIAEPVSDRPISIQRKGSGPGPEEWRREPATLQRAVAGNGMVAPSMDEVASRAIAEAGGGRPLDPTIRGMLESRLGVGLGQVRIHDDSAARAAAHALDARAFTYGNDIWLGAGASQFDTQLMAHEATHVVQQGGGGARMVQRDDGKGGGRAAAPQTAGSPFAAQIAQDQSTAAPDTVSTTISLDIPGFGAAARSHETIALPEPVTDAAMITIYSVPLSELYASPEIAEAARAKPEKERHALSIAGSPDIKLPSAKPAAGGAVPPPAVTGAPPSATTPPAPAATTPPTAATITGEVRNAGPSPGSNVEVAYDINGHPLGIIQRGAEWGLTAEYTKLAVGAAACGVVRTKQGGVRLIDAGVRHDEGVVATAMVKHAVQRLKELAGNEPIRDIVITHAHLDHVALLDRLSTEFVIQRLTINALQVVDPRFAARARDIAANQRKLISDQLTAKYQAQRDTWLTDAKTGKAAFEFPNPGAREAQFQEWVRDQVALEMAKLPPIEVHVALPVGSTINAAEVKIGGIEVKPVPATSAGPREGFVSSEPFQTTLLDPNFKEKLEAYQRELATNPNAEFKGLDAMSSNVLMRLPNGNQLVVMPDIRAADLLRLQQTLVSEFGKLGAKVNFRVWDVGHHAQPGWLTGGKNTAIRASQLSKMTDLLSKLTAARGGRAGVSPDAIAVSVDLGKVDPALVYLLESCGLRPVLAHSEQDVQFAEAITAADRKVGGLTSGEPYNDYRIDPVLWRTDVALEDLRRRLDEVTSGAAQEVKDQKQEAKTREAELKPQRDAVAKQITSLRQSLRNAQKNVRDPGKLVAKRPLAERQAEVSRLQGEVIAKEKERDALDQEVKDIRERVGPLQTEQAQLKERIGKINAAKKAFIQK